MTTTKKRSFTVQENAKWMHYRINDILYGYLKVNATYYENPNDPDRDHYLYITKQKEREIRKEVAEKMKCTEGTIRRHLRILVDEGLIKEFTLISNNGKKYASYGIVQDAPPFVLVSNDWLKNFITCRSMGGLKVYIYLLRKQQIANYYGNEHCFFTIKEIAEAMGYEDTDKSTTLEKISIILNDLQQSRIIRYKETYIQTKEGKPSPRKELLFIVQSEEEREEKSEILYKE